MDPRAWAKRRRDLSTRRGIDEGGRTNCWKTATSAPSLARAAAVRVLATDPDPSGMACVRCDVNGERVRAWSCGAKTCGMGAGRKLKTHRRNQRWADKAYKKSHLGNEWKKPFAGSSHAKGIVLEKIGIEAKQPNSAICKCARVQLVKNGKKIAAFVPNDGCLNFIKENLSARAD
uniref:40S ribosomal protein S23 n=1 Tax=Oryza glumipatula TaxID=40148 RepID=A0A0D9ZWR0_9ORYZ